VRRVYTGIGGAIVAVIIAGWVAAGSLTGGYSHSGCPLPNYPDASCTGVPPGTDLTTVDPAVGDSQLSPVSGGLAIITNGTVVDSKSMDTCIYLRADNITIRNSKAACIVWDNGSGTLVEDSTIDGNGPSNTPGPGGHFGTCIERIKSIRLWRLDVSGCENGLDINGPNVRVEDSYIHDLVFGTNPSNGEHYHTDGVQTSPLIAFTVFRHNTISSYDTSAINLFNDPYPIQPHNILITQNRLRMESGAAALYCPRHPNPDPKIVVTDNRMKAGVRYGDTCIVGFSVEKWDRNVDDDTGAVVAAGT